MLILIIIITVVQSIITFYLIKLLMDTILSISRPKILTAIITAIAKIAKLGEYSLGLDQVQDKPLLG